MGWHPALTGIRAVAILAVLGFHLALPLPQGGPAGVTVFFVLSGFLITTLLIREWTATGSIAMGSYFWRRARRLLPALVAAVGLVYVVALASGQAGAIGMDSVLALTYVANWARAGGDLMGLWNHTWSLAIEEQFYLAWPIVFVALQRIGGMRSRRVIGIVIAVAIASASARGLLEVMGASGDRIYFGSDTRAEALLMGCALAGLVARHGGALPVPAWAGRAALLALGALMLLPDTPSPWPGAFYSFVSIATCALILAAIRPDGGGCGLALWPMVWLGERSYSLYLWHVPVILAVGPTLGEVHPLVRIGILATISVLLAAASYAVIERPFLRSRQPGVFPAKPTSLQARQTA